MKKLKVFVLSTLTIVSMVISSTADTSYLDLSGESKSRLFYAPRGLTGDDIGVGGAKALTNWEKKYPGRKIISVSPRLYSSNSSEILIGFWITWEKRPLAKD